MADTGAANQQPQAEAPAQHGDLGSTLVLLYPHIKPPNNAYISADIVAIHGLGSNPKTTWTCNVDENGRAVNWLKDLDMLPSLVPDARIWSFEYHSKWSGEVPVQQIEWLAEQLLAVMQDNIARRDARPRPIVFVAHSFGGIILTAALTSKSIKSWKYSYILTATAGAIFLGTPFTGASRLYASAGLIHAGASKLLGIGGELNLVKAMLPGSKLVRELRPVFEELVLSEGLQILCIFEQLRTPLAPKAPRPFKQWMSRRVVSDKQSVLQNSRTLGFPTTHQKMNEFAGPQDPNYERLSTEIRELVNHSPRVLREKARLALKRPFMTVPYKRNTNFVSRKALSKEIEGVLDINGKCVLYGLTGVGKSQLALEYAYTEKDRSVGSKHPSSDLSFLWVHAGTRSSFEQCYIDLAKQAGIFDELQSLKANLLGLKYWLESPKSGYWLMIFDNIDSMTLFRGESQYKMAARTNEAYCLSELIPENPNGQIIFTSRDRRLFQNILPSIPIVFVGPMSLEESMTLILSLRAGETVPPDKLSALLNEVDGNPLALAQIVAHLDNMSIADCLESFILRDDFQLKLLNQEFQAHGRQQGGPNATTKTWMASFDMIDYQTPKTAKELLTTIALLGRSHVPKALLFESPNDSDVADNVELVLEAMRSFQIIKMDKDSDRFFETHRLAQISAIAWLNDGGVEHFKEAVARVVQSTCQKFPFPDPNFWKICEMYLPHVQSLLKHASQQDVRSGGTITLFERIGLYFSSQGHYHEATRHLDRALQMAKKVRNKNCLDNHRLMLDISTVYCALARVRDAEKLVAEVVNLQEDWLGHDHPATLHSKAILALRRSELSVLDDSEAILKDAEVICLTALEKQKQILPVLDRNLMESKAILGKIYHLQGRHNEAAVLFHQVYESRRISAGGKHPDVLAVQLDIAALYIDVDERYKSQDILTSLAPHLGDLYSEHHPERLRAAILGEQSLWDKSYGEAGYIKNRRTLIEQELDLALEDNDPRIARIVPAENIIAGYKRIFGSNHPDYLIALTWLLHIQMSLRSASRCETLALNALGISVSLFGPEHSKSLDIMSKLVKIYSWNLSYDKSEELGARVLEIRTRRLGREHPQTIAAMSNLLAACAANATSYHRSETAPDLAKELLTIREKIEESYQRTEASNREWWLCHCQTMVDMANLVLYYFNSGQWEDAAIVGRQVANDLLKTMPVGAIEIVESCDIAAQAWMKLNRPLVAVRFQWQALLHSWSKQREDTTDHKKRMGTLKEWVNTYHRDIKGKIREKLVAFLEEEDYQVLMELNLEINEAEKEVDEANRQSVAAEA